MKVHSVRAAVVCLALGAAVQATWGDLVVRKDGSVLEGKVVSRDARGLSFMAEGSKTAATIAATDVERVIVIDEKGAELQEGTGVGVPGKRAAARIDMPAEPKAPAVGKALAGPNYYVIPLHGVVGETVAADALEKSLADAALRHPTVVVLDINSPGGSVAEAEAMMKILHTYNKTLRIIALADQNLSAAAITSLSVKEIYVKSSSTTGAATAYDPVNMDLPPDIKEKMESAWRAVARNSAEEGGHEPLLAEAMIDSSKTLHLETVDGKKVVKEGPGENIICQQGRILTLTSHEAVSVGLAVDIADDYKELGDMLKFKGWQECPGLGKALGDYLPKRWESFEKQAKEMDAALRANFDTAMREAPSDDEVTQRVITIPRGAQFPTGGGAGAGGGGFGRGPGGPIGGRGRGGQMIQPINPGGVTESIVTSRTVSPEMRAQWRNRSLATVVALLKVEAGAQDEIALAQAYGQQAMVEEIKDAIPTIGAMRAEVYANRNKYAGDAAAPPAVVTGPPAGRGIPGSAAGGAAPAPAGRPVRLNEMPAVAANNSPLPAAPSEAVKDAVSKKTYLPAAVIGANGQSGGDFLDLAPEGGVLIGMRVGQAGFNGGIITAIQPVYLTPKGIVMGNIHGNPSVGKVTDLVAREGYVVEGISLQGGANLSTVELRFMRMTATGLDPRDSYASERVGTNVPSYSGGGNSAAIGIVGRTNDRDAVGIGLVSMPNGAGGMLAVIRNTPAAPVNPGRQATPTAPPVNLAKLPPLPEDFAATIKAATDKKSYRMTPVISGTQVKEGFTDIAADGVLIGVRCGMGRSGATEVIYTVQAIYLSPKGVVMGPAHGNASATVTRTVDLAAREGYVVGGAKIQGTTNLEGLKLKYVRLTDGKLNAGDEYESDVAGRVDHPTTLGSPTPVIGITGRGNDLSTQLGLGLVSVNQ